MDDVLFGASTGTTKYIAKKSAAKFSLEMLSQQYPSIEVRYVSSKTRIIMSINNTLTDEELSAHFLDFYNSLEDNLIFELFELGDQLKIHEKAFAHSMKSQSIHHENGVQIKVSKNINYYQLYLYLRLNGSSEKYLLREATCISV